MAWNAVEQRTAGARKSRAAQPRIPWLFEYRRFGPVAREIVFGGVFWRLPLRGEGAPGPRPQTPKNRSPKTAPKTAGRAPKNARNTQKTEGPATPFHATVAPSRAWRGSRFQVGRAIIRSRGALRQPPTAPNARRRALSARTFPHTPPHASAPASPAAHAPPPGARPPEGARGAIGLGGEIRVFPEPSKTSYRVAR